MAPQPRDIVERQAQEAHSISKTRMRIGVGERRDAIECHQRNATNELSTRMSSAHTWSTRMLSAHVSSAHNLRAVECSLRPTPLGSCSRASEMEFAQQRSNSRLPILSLRRNTAAKLRQDLQDTIQVGQSWSEAIDKFAQHKVPIQ